MDLLLRMMLVVGAMMFLATFIAWAKAEPDKTIVWAIILFAILMGGAAWMITRYVTFPATAAHSQ